MRDEDTKLTFMQQEKLHILYTRIVNLAHLMNLVCDEFVETNQDAFLY